VKEFCVLKIFWLKKGIFSLRWIKVSQNADFGSLSRIFSANSDNKFVGCGPFLKKDTKEKLENFFQQDFFWEKFSAKIF